LADLLSSKVVVMEEPPRIRGVTAAPTSVAGAIGIAERGPIGVPVLCTSFEDYQTYFGGFTANSDLALAAMGLFQNGGTQLWVVRTVHYKDITDATTATALTATGFLTTPGAPAPAVVLSAAALPLVLADGAQIVVSIGGGPDQPAVVHGSAAQITSGNAGPFALVDGQTLGIKVDKGLEQIVTFQAAAFANIGAATPLEVAEAVNTQLFGGKALIAAGKLVLASDTEGLASAIEVSSGSAEGAFAFPGGAVEGAGNVQNVRAVTLAELTAIVTAAIPALAVQPQAGGLWGLVTVAAGAAVTLQVRPATSAAFGLDQAPHQGSDSGAVNAFAVNGCYPGSYANQVTVEVEPPSNGAANTFDLAVLENGVFKESFPNLSADPANARYVLTIVNDPNTGSELVRIVDLGLPKHPAPAVQSLTLSGGDDGLTGLDDQDFIGSATSKTGLQAFNQVQELALLLVPGRATPAVHNGMLSYCEQDRGGLVFAVLDPPEGASATDIVAYVELTAGLLETSEYGAIYWPRLLVLNPDTTVFGPSANIVAPPSGVVCGVCARTDAARPGGVYDPPAGIVRGQMTGVVGFETNEVLEESKRDLVYPKRINPLTTGTGLPLFIDGSRTLKSSGNFPYVAERRGVIFIEKSLRQGLQFARHENNTESLRATVRRTVTAFLIVQMKVGAFRSTDPKTAFFVDVSDALNPPSVIFAGQLILRVGLATNKPAEFIILRISQDTRALDQELATTTGSGPLGGQGQGP
jgi:phage tail sheath protein FI